MDKISIVIPVYFNEDSLEETYRGIVDNVSKSRQEFDYEIVFVDDGSGDNSYNVMKGIAGRDSKVKLVRLSRNFGSYVAILAGLKYADGDAFTFLPADLQDPPELVPMLYEKWLETDRKDIVLAVRSSREDPLPSRIYSYLFYKLFRAFVLPEYPEKGYDCFFINRQQRDLIISMNEKNSHLMAQIVWLGYGQHHVEYHRRKRKHGKSRWTLFKKFKLAFDTFFGFSGRPLRIASLLGMIISLAGFLLALIIVLRRMMFDAPIFGIPSVIVAILVTGGFILLCLGIVGEYMWRNFDETRKRPTFVVRETINCN